MDGGIAVILDANSVDPGACLRADVCVIGGGPAGIALALSLTGQRLEVILLESGWKRRNAATQSLYEGEVVDERLHSPADRYRDRCLGGSTLTWGGRTLPYDPIDFETRAWVPNSGWPIPYEDLLRFYPAANLLAEAGRFSYEAGEALGADVPPMIRGFDSQVVRTDGIERFSCPTNFGRRYERRLRVARDVRILLGANCTRIELTPDGRRVRDVCVSTLAGSRFRVAARTTVLAGGGIETARLLLASRSVVAAGVGNEHDVVGRYYQCHIAGNVGTLEFSGRTGDVRHGYEISPEGIYCRRRFSIAPQEQRRAGLTNCVARLHFPRISDPRHRNGVLSGLFLSRGFISYEYGKRLNDAVDPGVALYARHAMNVLMDPVDTTAFLAHWAARRTFAHRKYPSVVLRNRTNRFSLEMHGEQVPRADSRITLTDRIDELGMPRVRIDWRYSRDDIDSVRRTVDLIARELARTGVGRLRYDVDTFEEDLMRFGAYGGHHIGTARMGVDPRTSVVDPDCRVHSVDNLYVAGSAAFPTSSQANPTLTLIALALRLGGHLSRRLVPGAAAVV